MAVVTFDDLVAREPMLGHLYEAVDEVDGSSSDFCANRIWYDRFKPLLVRLVGYEARLDELRSEAAYDLAYETLYERLPACQHESTAFCL
jgi:hypothetical protein